jgi:hypothetical protein
MPCRCRSRPYGHSSVVSRANHACLVDAGAGYVLEVPVDGYVLEVPVDGYVLEVPVDGYVLEVPVDGYVLEVPVDALSMPEPAAMERSRGF